MMRPTWHFVTPEDIRWLLALTAPRVNAAVASHYRKLELDEAQAHLLPAFDEYTVAYKDRTTILDPPRTEQTNTVSPGLLLDGLHTTHNRVIPTDEHLRTEVKNVEQSPPH